jgi:hypothetical protein
MSLQLLINDYLKNFSNFEDLRIELYKKNILTKDYIDDGLMLIYHKYDQKTNTDLERECRSIVIDKKTKKVISYSCETPMINSEAFNYLLLNQSDKKVITKCYEGTLLSVFYNDKWFVSTRRCLNSDESIWGNDNKSHYNMFNEILKESKHNNFEEFTNKLDKNYCYYFVLVHYQNKNIVDYLSEFGSGYKKLILAFVRDKESQTEINLYDNDLLQKIKLSEIMDNNIFIAEKLENLESFDMQNQKEQFQLPPTMEGIIIKVFDEVLQKNKLFKLQTKSYQFAKSIGSDKNIYMGLIHLYQKEKLKDYLSDTSLNQNIKKILNPINTQESYDTIGAIDALFKVTTSELFELFKKLYDLKTGKSINSELYNLLPKEYKDVLFLVRGLYYKKKEEGIKMNKQCFLQINDIYNLLKNSSTENFCALVRMRKLMNNWTKVNNKLEDFSKISIKCDKIHYKLAAIYSNKLFPNINIDEIPLISIVNNKNVIE